MKLKRFTQRGGNGFRTRLVRGDWNAISDSSGLQHKASELVQQWDGLMVARDDVEERHPQDYLRGVTDKIRVPWARPDANKFST